MKQWDGRGLCKPNYNQLITLKPLINETLEMWKGQHRPLRSGDTHCGSSRHQGHHVACLLILKTSDCVFILFFRITELGVCRDHICHAYTVSGFNLICKRHVLLDFCLEPFSKTYHLATLWFTTSFRSPIFHRWDPRRQKTSSEVYQFACGSEEGNIRDMKTTP